MSITSQLWGLSVAELVMQRLSLCLLLLLLLYVCMYVVGPCCNILGAKCNNPQFEQINRTESSYVNRSGRCLMRLYPKSMVYMQTLLYFCRVHEKTHILCDLLYTVTLQANSSEEQFPVLRCIGTITASYFVFRAYSSVEQELPLAYRNKNSFYTH